MEAPLPDKRTLQQQVNLMAVSRIAALLKELGEKSTQLAVLYAEIKEAP